MSRATSPLTCLSQAVPGAVRLFFPTRAGDRGGSIFFAAAAAIMTEATSLARRPRRNELHAPEAFGWMFSEEKS